MLNNNPLKSYVITYPNFDDKNPIYLTFTQVDSNYIEVSYTYEYAFATQFSTESIAKQELTYAREGSSLRFAYLMDSDILVGNLIIAECEITLKEVV